MLRHTWRQRSMKMCQISENTLFIPKFGTLELLTKATSNGVMVMTSWWNISGMFRMWKISDMLYHTWRHQWLKRGQFLDIWEFFSYFAILVAFEIPKFHHLIVPTFLLLLNVSALAISVWTFSGHKNRQSMWRIYTSDYGKNSFLTLLKTTRWTIERLFGLFDEEATKKSPGFNLQFKVCGSHRVARFGITNKDLFHIMSNQDNRYVTLCAIRIQLLLTFGNDGSLLQIKKPNLTVEFPNRDPQIPCRYSISNT